MMIRTASFLQIARVLGLSLEDLVQELIRLSADLAYIGLMFELGEESRVLHQVHLSG